LWPRRYALAGQYLAVMTIARPPMLVFQSLQTLYLTSVAWLCGLVAAIVMVVFAPSLVTAATLPLAVGALVAALILARPLLRRGVGKCADG